MITEDPIPDIRDIAPAVEIPSLAPYFWGGGTLLVLLLLLLFFLWLRKSREPETSTGPAPTPREKALAALEELKPQRTELDPIEFSTRLCDILRNFYAAQYQLDATRQTSQEFLAQAGRSPLFTSETRKVLEQFLERCDLIKFAHQVEGGEEVDRLCEQALQLLEARGA